MGATALAAADVRTRGSGRLRSCFRSLLGVRLGTRRIRGDTTGLLGILRLRLPLVPAGPAALPRPACGRTVHVRGAVVRCRTHAATLRQPSIEGLALRRVAPVFERGQEGPAERNVVRGAPGCPGGIGFRRNRTWSRFPVALVSSGGAAGGGAPHGWGGCGAGIGESRRRDVAFPLRQRDSSQRHTTHGGTDRDAERSAPQGPTAQTCGPVGTPVIPPARCLAILVHALVPGLAKRLPRARLGGRIDR